MKAKKINHSYIIRLEKGEEIVKTLTQFCLIRKIKAGDITGIGGTNNTVLKYYDSKKGKYLSKRFYGKNYEIAALTGNISLVNKKPILHIHILISDSTYRVLGGHMESAVISITGEIIITPTRIAIERQLNEEFKLNFLDI